MSRKRTVKHDPWTKPLKFGGKRYTNMGYFETKAGAQAKVAFLKPMYWYMHFRIVRRFGKWHVYMGAPVKGPSRGHSYRGR